MTPFYDILAALAVFVGLLGLSYACVAQRMPPAATAALGLWWFGAAGAAVALFSIYQLFWFMPAALWLNLQLGKMRFLDAVHIPKATPLFKHFLISGAVCIPLLLGIATLTEI